MPSCPECENNLDIEIDWPNVKCSEPESFQPFSSLFCLPSFPFLSLENEGKPENVFPGSELGQELCCMPMVPA